MEWLKSNKIYYIDFKYIIEITEITADNREKMHNANRRDGKKEKEEREWEKEINRVEYVCRVSDYISSIYCSIFVNMIFCESFQLEMVKVILV